MSKQRSKLRPNLDWVLGNLSPKPVELGKARAMDAATRRFDAARRDALKTRAVQPGSDGLWTFVFIDMLVFLLIFFTFMAERMRHPDAYLASQQQLNVWFGLANTLILLTSSWMVVEAVRSTRARDAKRVVAHLTLALLLGLAFTASKAAEYHSKLTLGITPVTSPFFSFYFFITIAHFMHVVAGMMFIAHYRNAAKGGIDSPRYLVGLENVGLFWHYVDVLWIFIFPLLYLVGRR